MPEIVETILEVRWGECDPAGIVYHPAYFDWFSVARMHFFKHNDMPYMEQFHDNGVVLVVLDARCEFLKTVRAEDMVRIEASLSQRSKSRLKVHYDVFDEQGTLCGRGYTAHAYVDVKTNRAVNLAKRAPQLWQRLEAVPLIADAAD